MGKRELVLILAFVFLGTILYQATAPPKPEGRGFSLRGMIDNIRREVGARHEYLADERTQAIPIGAGIAEVRLVGPGDLRIEGTDGAQAIATLQVYSTGLDENEARALGRKTVLKTSGAGDLLSLEMSYPREGRQRAMMTIRLPRRLRVRVSRVSRLEARNLGGVELDNTRGTATVSSIAGIVRGTHNGGELTLEHVKAIDLAARRSEMTIAGVDGPVRLDLTGGTCRARNIAGDFDVDGNRVDLDIEGLAGTLTADLSQGSIEVTRLAKQARVDARGTEIRIALERPVPISAITTDEDVSVRLPEHGGFTLDATVENGEIRLPERAPAPARTGQTTIAQGAIRGGGPTLSLRTTHGDIVVR